MQLLVQLIIGLGMFSLVSCKSHDSDNDLYFKALKRGITANQQALIKIDTVRITNYLYRNQKFLVEFSLYTKDTISKTLANQLLQLNRINNCLKTHLKNRNHLLSECKKMEMQLLKLEECNNKPNPELVFEGLCHELNAIKLLTQTVSKVSSQINQNFKVADSLRADLALYLKK